ncbi:MAG: hypothetical protein SF187_10745 [Deltaproteobacteria bacterium]|nr:hypothetical protein [Deltaproteobacteria bacterium]
MPSSRPMLFILRNAGWMALLLSPLAAMAGTIEVPHVSDPDLALQLVASEPAVVTPIGLAVDAQGALLVVQSHTHFRPAAYKGPLHDQVVRLQDKDHDGTFETRTVFADSFTFAMNLAVRQDGAVVVVERNKVTAWTDKDNDGKADSSQTLLTLTSATTYPHNGLGNLIFGPDGWLYVGVGDNQGNTYSLQGRDGRTLRGGEGEGGGVFRCKPDGTQLERYATGFWNPFGFTFHGDGMLLAIDDDPETRPPNRLLDLVRGGDFGFRFRYGATADHAFVAWNGELPGTLPMAGMAGEAASSVLSTVHLRWPQRYANKVLVTSWADRRIEVNTVRASGASVKSDLQILVQGGRSFRPVALAAAADGSVFFTDWVKRDYSVHGLGRIWRLSPRKPAAPLPAPAISPARARLLTLSGSTGPLGATQIALATKATDADPFSFSAAVTALANEPELRTARQWLTSRSAKQRLAALLAFKQAQNVWDRRAPETKEIILRALNDAALDVRMAAIIYGTEAGWLSAQDAEALAGAARRKPTSLRLRHVYQAATALLQDAPAPDLAVAATDDLMQRLAQPAQNPVQVRAQQEALWRLAQTPLATMWPRLEAVAKDARFATTVRADAIGVLAMHGHAQGLAPLLADPARPVRVETARALRAALGDKFVVAALESALKTLATPRADAGLREEVRFALQTEDVTPEVRPQDQAQWQRALQAKPGDAEAGRRAFVHPGVGCARCHRVALLGGHVGPPLTFMGDERPARLLESLLDPSLDVVWSARQFETRDGSSYVGMVKNVAADGTITLANAAGQLVKIAKADLVSETKADASLMPDGLLDTLTVQGVRDLYAFLRQAHSMHPFSNEDAVIQK